MFFGEKIKTIIAYHIRHLLCITSNIVDVSYLSRFIWKLEISKQFMERFAQYRENQAALAISFEASLIDRLSRNFTAIGCCRALALTIEV